MTDREGFFVGVNLPWLTYGCDFGANAWQGEGGIGQCNRSRRLDEIFGRLSAAGLRVVRWFVFCDGRAGVRFDDDGRPTGLDGFVFRDLDAAMAAAARHRLTLLPVLFDFLWCARRQVVNGVQVGGRRRSFARRSYRQSLIEQVVSPVVARYGSEPAVECWDLFNEPEWATLGWGSANPFASVRPGAMRSLLGEIVAVVREYASQPVTVGLASAAGLPLLEGIDLDIYQVHWYDRVSAFVEDVRGRLGKPVMLGEFPTDGTSRATDEILRGARERGYCGALGWSALALDPYSRLAALESAVGQPRRA